MSISSRVVGVSLCALASSLLPLAALAQTPALLNYQGRLLNGTNLVNGNVGLSLRLFDASAAGSLLYEDSNTVTVTDGLYATLIGDTTTFGQLPTALENTNVWIEVSVNGAALTPRERLVSAAYAVKAQKAQTFTGAVQDTQLSANIARLNGTNQTFSGPVTFSSVSNSFTGTFKGNAETLTNVQLSAVIASQPPVIAWGWNGDGQTTVPATATSVVAIAGGESHSLALRAGGTVIAWGAGTSDLNDLINEGQSMVPAGATGIVGIAAGAAHSLALRSDGMVIGWGFNLDGQTTVPASATGVVAIAAGVAHSLALRSNGTVIAWGYNGNGQTTVPASATNVVAIAGGGYHSLALRSDGTVIAWGSNGAGQTTVPASATNVVAIAGGGYHSLALRADGTVIAWGAGTNGDNSGNGYGQSIVPASATGVVAIAGGQFHSLALRSDGTAIAWGRSNSGQTTVPASAMGVVAIACGRLHSLALRTGRIPAQVALLDRDNLFAGAVSAASFVGNGSELTNIGNASLASDVMTNIAARLASNVWAAADSTTNFVHRTGDTMSGDLYVNGGVGIGTTNPQEALEVYGSAQNIRIANTSENQAGILFVDAQDPTNQFARLMYDANNLTNQNFNMYVNSTSAPILTVKGNQRVGVNTTSPSEALHVVGNIYASGTITPSSDRNVKKNFEPVDAQAILEKLSALPLQTWTYKAETDGVRHLGPMAQDFSAAFGLGANDISIATVDADGVALAAIQALATADSEQRSAFRVQQERIKSLETENAALKQQLDALARRQQQLESSLQAVLQAR